MKDALWGATVIAKFAGVSVETVYRWALLPDCPISQPGGRYFCIKSELVIWLKGSKKKAG
jgi:hypothetical protein